MQGGHQSAPKYMAPNLTSLMASLKVIVLRDLAPSKTNVTPGKLDILFLIAMAGVGLETVCVDIKEFPVLLSLAVFKLG